MKNKKKISIIGTVGVPAKYGGFETLVENLLDYRTLEDIQYKVYCSKTAYQERPKKYKAAKLVYIPLKANGVQSIFYDVVSIICSLFSSQVLLVLGTSGCIALPLVKMFTKKRIIVNIDGMEHRRDKWKEWVKRFLVFSEKIAVKYSDVVIADNKIVQNYVHKKYNKDAVLIAYGGDYSSIESTNWDILKEYNLEPNKYSITVCRIEPENNIHLILGAFSKISDQKLVVIGNWENSEYGIELKREYSQCENILMLNPIYDKQILNSFRRNCKMYIHGHSAGGTNPSLVEAMWIGVPIFAFDVDFNKETTENQAKFFINEKILCQLVKTITDDELTEMKLKLKRIADEKYTWEKITKMYEKLY